MRLQISLPYFQIGTMYHALLYVHMLRFTVLCSIGVRGYRGLQMATRSRLTTPQENDNNNNAARQVKEALLTELQSHELADPFRFVLHEHATPYRAPASLLSPPFFISVEWPCCCPTGRVTAFFYAHGVRSLWIKG